MGWPDKFLLINDKLKQHHNSLAAHGQQSDWWTISDLSKYMQWSEAQTRYWCEKMVDKRWLIWRYHPDRHGWYSTKQYAAPWLIAAKCNPL